MQFHFPCWGDNFRTPRGAAQCGEWSTSLNTFRSSPATSLMSFGCWPWLSRRQAETEDLIESSRGQLVYCSSTKVYSIESLIVIKGGIGSRAAQLTDVEEAWDHGAESIAVHPPRAPPLSPQLYFTGTLKQALVLALRWCCLSHPGNTHLAAGGGRIWWVLSTSRFFPRWNRP